MLTAVAAALFLVSSAQAGQATTVGHGGPASPVLHARVVGTPLLGSSVRPGPGPAPVKGLPSKKQQIKKLKATLANMHKNYKSLSGFTPGPQDVFDYNLAPLWLKGIDGAGTTVAVIEGWDLPSIGKIMKQFDAAEGLPPANITTIFPSGPLPKKCPHGMVILGSYGSCAAWGGELTLDVESAHIMAPYAKIVISATPADTQETDDAASNVAMPEMMHALEYITANHIANSISISDGTGETTYPDGPVEITSQDAGELTAAAGGIPVSVGTGDCGVVQNLAIANNQCGNTSPGPDTAAWDDSPWITALGGSVPNLNSKGQKVGPDPVWHVGGIFAEGAGYSSVFTRPSYQNGVANITRSSMRSVPDITMDASNGTSEAGPLFNGVLALATQVNHGRNVGPINRVLYRKLGPAGVKDGIVDVVKGNNSVVVNGKVKVQGFTAAKGFDVASGWGTINAAKFVPALVAATRAAHQDRGIRRQASRQLTGLEHSTTLSVTSIPKGGYSYLLGTGFLPLHPVTFTIDGKTIATLHANTLGDVTYMISPSLLKLSAGKHTVQLSGMVLTTTVSFTSH
jgi:subtilase family serine protease